MKRVILLYIGFAVMFLCFANFTDADVTAGSKRVDQLTGSVMSFTKTNITIIDTNNMRFSFIINEDTVINGEIVKGAEVTVTWTIRRLHTHKGGFRRIALVIRVLE